MFTDNFQTKDVSITRIKDLIKLILKKEISQNSAFISIFPKKKRKEEKGKIFVFIVALQTTV